MLERPDLLPPQPPAGLKVVQLTSGNLPACHVYMEAQVFTPDGKRLILHEAAIPHRGIRNDPRHRYLVCDLEDGGRLHPLTDEMNPTGPAVSPDGKHLYYFVDETTIDGGRLLLKRVGIDGSGRQTLLVLDKPLSGVGRRPSLIYPLSTIRSDGRKLATSCFLGDGSTENDCWGLLVFDLRNPEADLILYGREWCNMHPQYCRSGDPGHKCDILVQENHGCQITPKGEVKKLVGGDGADIHVITDDGRKFQDMPWGRDGNEFCQGHQCWRGRSAWAITSTITREPEENQLIEALAVPSAGHAGKESPGAVRNDLSRDFPNPRFFHFATDRGGDRLITDSGREDDGGKVYLARLGKPGEAPATAWQCIARPRSSWDKDAHIHPFLSPDGSRGFFNSDESGVLQAYMITGLELL